MDNVMEEDMQHTDTVLVQMPHNGLIEINVICRLCANPNERIIGIYSEEGISNNLATKMNNYLPVKVSENDSLPLQCCWSCASTVLAWHELVVASVEADRRLRELHNINEKDSSSSDIYSCMDESNSPEEPENKYANDLSVSSAPIQATIKEEPQNEDTKLKIEKYHYCAECNITFETNKLLVKHQAKKHGIAGNSDDESSTFCEPCNLTFESHYSLLEHTKLEHPSSNDPPKRRRRVDIVYDIFCDVCSTGFTRLVDMKKHRERKHPEADPYKPLVKKEIKQIGDSIICIECGSSFTKKIEFNDHMKKQHNRVIRRFRRNRSEITAQFFCDICGKGFTRKYDMEKHRKTKHPTDTLKPEEKLSQKQRNVQLLKRCQVPGDNNTTYYKCEICSRLFKKSYNLVKHMSIHTGARDYFCHICGKNFRVSNGLYRHISEHHYGIKKHPCEICGKFFATTATRDDHRNIHTDTRPFICDICGKAFRQKASLHVHKLFHSNNFRFTCNICGKKYRRSTELKIHSWLHTGHKPHQCHLCEARFRLRQDLKRHIKIHNKLTECICHECGSVFSQEKYLNNHKKIHVVKGPLALVMAPLPPL